jgi:hypothetical protein
MTDSPETEKKEVDLASLTDDEILAMDPSEFAESPEDSESGELSPDSTEESSQEDASTGNEADEGGSESESESGDGTSEEDTASAEEDTETDTETEPDKGEERPSESDQDSDKASSEADAATEDQSADVDWKAEYEKVMAPFMAAKREFKLKNIDEARRLMQMGVGFSKKMTEMKPYLRVIQTLKQNDLLDEEKLNFLIDLNGKKPEAIKKLLQDSSIDPLDLDLEGGSDYKATNHMLGDDAVELANVMDGIRGTETFTKCTKFITGMDTHSRSILMDNPGLIEIINDHMNDGTFDIIEARLDREKILGNLKGLSDLEAYKKVGEALQEEGTLGTGPAPKATKTPVDNADDSEQKAKDDAKRQDQKRKASAPKGKAGPGKKKAPDLSKMSDEEVLALDPSLFS